MTNRAMPPTPNRSTSRFENEVVPLYFDRDTDGIPRRWTQLVKEAIRTSAPSSAPAGWSRNTPSECTPRR